MRYQIITLDRILNMYAGTVTRLVKNLTGPHTKRHVTSETADACITMVSICLIMRMGGHLVIDAA